MKKFIYGISFLALIGIIIFGCQKENLNPTPSSTIQNNQKGTGKVDPKEFAQLHNEYLLKAIDYATNNNTTNAKLSLMHVDIPYLTDDEKSKIFDYFSNITEQEMKDSTFKYFVNPKAEIYYTEIETILDNAIDYTDLNQKLDIIAEKIDQDLEGNDWDIVMVTLETTRASAYVWFSEERGGSGIGYRYALTSPNHLAKKRPDWVGADGRGAGYGMVTWGLSGLFVGGPVGGLGGFLYGAISGAVFSSLDAL